MSDPIHIAVTSGIWRNRMSKKIADLIIVSVLYSEFISLPGFEIWKIP